MTGTSVGGVTTIRTIEQLEALYAAPVPTSITKEIDHLTELHRAYVEASPFVVVATSGPGGLDCSPRGDPPGFVRVLDERTLLLADRRGNNRLDTLRNLVGRSSHRAALPRSRHRCDAPGERHGGDLDRPSRSASSLAMDDKLPTTVIVVSTTAVYTQCPKALIRSQLWDACPPS